MVQFETSINASAELLACGLGYYIITLLLHYYIIKGLFLTLEALNGQGILRSAC